MWYNTVMADEARPLGAPPDETIGQARFPDGQRNDQNRVTICFSRSP